MTHPIDVLWRVAGLALVGASYPVVVFRSTAFTSPILPAISHNMFPPNALEVLCYDAVIWAVRNTKLAIALAVAYSCLCTRY